MIKIKKIKFLLILGVLFSIFICFGCSTVSTNISANYISINKADNEEGDYAIISDSNDLTFLSLDVIPEKYDDNYFMTYSLIVVTIVESNQNRSGEIKSYSIENEKITIYVETLDSKQMDSLQYWYYILEIKNKEIECSKLLEIYKNGKIITQEKIPSKDEIAYENYLKHFQLEEEKWFWDGDINDEFADNAIIIDLKKTSTYPEFNLAYLGIPEAISFEYISGQFPPDYFFKEEYAELLTKFRQILAVYLVPQEKERIIEIIREIEKLEFVKLVSPDMIINSYE